MNHEAFRALNGANQEIYRISAVATGCPTLAEVEALAESFKRCLIVKATAAEAMYFSETPQTTHLTGSEEAK